MGTYYVELCRNLTPKRVEHKDNYLQKVALQEQLAQKTRNKTREDAAESAKKIAITFNQAKEAQISLTDLRIREKLASATLKWASKWNGVLPNKILPEGSNLMLSMNEKNK